MRIKKKSLLLSAILILVTATVAWAVVKMNRRGTGGIEYDAPRTAFTLRAVNFTAATTEALITLTPIRDYVEGATGTSFTVTGGKRLRLVGLCISTKNAGAAGQGVQVRVRVNPSGAVTTSSPPIFGVGAGTYLAIANVVGATCAPLDRDNGIELSGTAQVGISQIGTATAGNDLFLYGYEY